MNAGLPTRRLGDLEVTVAGLGCNNFGRRIGIDETRAVIDAALEAGINFLDTADVYGDGRSEELIGEVLADGRRERVVLATKFGMGRSAELPGAPGSAAYVRAACDASLRRLRTGTIDLLQYHKPNPDVAIEETLGAMHELVGEGKVRALGVSNFSASQLEEACRVAPVASLQNEHSLLRRKIERDVIPACEALGVGVLPYFPLASGLLTGKYRRGEQAPEGTRLAGRAQLASDAEWDAIEALERFAHARGIELIDVAIGGLAARPAVASVIAGATKPEQVRRNAAAARWQPTADDLEEIDRILP
jgi:aryl-alcohol dehydrogenase-like predicted oxidoreductase